MNIWAWRSLLLGRLLFHLHTCVRGYGSASVQDDGACVREDGANLVAEGAVQLQLVAPKSNDKVVRPAPTTLFCFAWMPGRKEDVDLLPFVRQEFASCDGHAIFTDQDAAIGDGDDGLIRVKVPAQSRSRDDNLWLYHRNMVGLLPAWTYLFEHGIPQKYDWVINSELDHFMIVSRVRSRIDEYLSILRNGSERERNSTSGAMLLMWGNAFLFNRQLVIQMGDDWDTIGNATTSGDGVGCPEIARDHMWEWPESCAQDMFYPYLASWMQIGAYGASGCAQPSRSDLKKSFPLACWQFAFREWESDWKGLTETALREIALMERKNLTADQLEEHCNTRGPEVQEHCQELFAAMNVPLFHALKRPEFHQLAHDLFERAASAEATAGTAAATNSD